MEVIFSSLPSTPRPSVYLISNTHHPFHTYSYLQAVVCLRWSISTPPLLSTPALLSTPPLLSTPALLSTPPLILTLPSVLVTTSRRSCVCGGVRWRCWRTMPGVARTHGRARAGHEQIARGRDCAHRGGFLGTRWMKNTHTHNYVHTYTCMHTYIHMHAYIHTYIHTYTHTHTHIALCHCDESYTLLISRTDWSHALLILSIVSQIHSLTNVTTRFLL